MKSALFRGITDQEMPGLLDCLGAQEKSYGRGEIILQAGEPVTGLGLMLEGAAQVVQYDYWGNRSILAALAPGDLFAEAFCCAGVERLPVSVVAGPARVLLLRGDKLPPCGKACPWHGVLSANLLGIMAAKNVGLTQKISHVSKRSMEQKLLSYLSEQARQQGSSSFRLAFDRQELADYLGVDRSALCRQLGVLQERGLLQYNRRQITLLAKGQEQV